MKTLSKEVIEQTVEAKGYKWFEEQLNIVGIRTADKTTNLFNDYVTFSWKDKATGKWNFIGFEATTDPGLYYLQNPGRVVGTGILVPDQYYNVWQWGMGSNGYNQLLQRGAAVKVYRDKNRDQYLDMDPKTIEEGYFGMNLHRAHATVLQKWVGKYSAMCQVIRDNAEAWPKVVEIVEKLCPQKFYTYTLLVESDFK